MYVGSASTRVSVSSKVRVVSLQKLNMMLHAVAVQAFHLQMVFSAMCCSHILLLASGSH